MDIGGITPLCIYRIFLDKNNGMRQVRKRNQFLGFYMPSMFHLHVHTTADIGHWEKWDDKTLCTFLHEYIHFLQDISTVSGLYNIYVLGECLVDRVNQIYDMPDGSIQVPIQIIQGPNNVLNNQKVSDAVEGDYDLNRVDEDNLQVSGKATVISVPWTLNGQTIPMHEVHVPFAGGGDFLLGNYHITESMAYLGEIIVYGNMNGVVEPSPNYPYDVVRQLAYHYSDKLANNLSLLFCLCDLALTFSHSGYALVYFFDKYVNKGCPNAWRQFVVDLVHNSKGLTPVGEVNYMDGLMEIKNLAIRELDLKFNNDSYNDIRRWYYNIINRAVGMRRQNPLYIYDFLSGGELKHNILFKHLLSGIGTPVMTNDFFQSCFTEHVVGCALNKRKAEYMIAAGSITYAMGNADFPCKLRHICKAEHRCMDKNCVRAPWRHARKWFVCPYGHLWYG